MFAKIGGFVAAIALGAAGTAYSASVNDFIDWSLYNPSNGNLQLPGRLYVPANYDPQKTYPIVMFLHGYGERGTDNLAQINSNIDPVLSHCKTEEAFLFAPQCSPTSGWGGGATLSNSLQRAMTLLDRALENYNIDPNRQYVTGLSNGGLGTWEAITKVPGRFAAAVPICANYTPSAQTAELLVDTPIWVFHARDDNSGTNPVSYSRNAVNRILVAGGYHEVKFPLDQPDGVDYFDGSPYYETGYATFLEINNIRYTEYVTGGHNIWGRAYREEPLYEWMFSQAIPEPTFVGWLILASAGILRRQRH